MGWEIYPEGLYEIVKRVSEEYQPEDIYITENGIALPDQPDSKGRINDQKRIDYLRSHLLALHRAVDEGCPVSGYFVWSLMDNFEWAFGFSKRFGLVYVDYTTLQRIKKASFYWYQKVIKSKRVD
jgi:beta-glucosidase